MSYATGTTETTEHGRFDRARKVRPSYLIAIASLIALFMVLVTRPADAVGSDPTTVQHLDDMEARIVAKIDALQVKVDSYEYKINDIYNGTAAGPNALQASVNAVQTKVNSFEYKINDLYHWTDPGTFDPWKPEISVCSTASTGFDIPFAPVGVEAAIDACFTEEQLIAQGTNVGASFSAANHYSEVAVLDAIHDTTQAVESTLSDVQGTVQNVGHSVDGITYTLDTYLPGIWNGVATVDSGVDWMLSNW